jgi:hypothetical protein
MMVWSKFDTPVEPEGRTDTWNLTMICFKNQVLAVSACEAMQCAYNARTPKYVTPKETQRLITY